MDKIKLLQARREKVLAAGTDIRKAISSLIDADSFVELSGFSFSKNDLFDAEAEGDGVVTGFATVDGYPVYIAAQNFAVLHGGACKAGCEKIGRMLALAEKNSTPIVYVLHSRGMQIGEGITALEGMAQLLAKAAKLHGVVPQFAVVDGEVYGQSALLAACADFTFFMKDSVLAADSPLVIAAKSGKNLPEAQVGGAEALPHTGLVSFAAESYKEVRETVRKILDILPDFSGAVVENGADLNAVFPALDEGCTASELIEAVFDADSAVEVGKGCSPEVRCVLGRVGGIAAAAVVFDGADGVLLDAENVAKITDFAEFASYYSLPLITFADVRGIRPDLQTNDSRVLKNCFKLLETYDLIESAKISVVWKRAVGLGYTLFAAKSAGFDYSYAFATAQIALFEDVKGAEIEFAGEKADAAKLAARYADENADPINAAKNGYVDNIIRPQFVKQYLVASLQMLLK